MRPLLSPPPPPEKPRGGDAPEDDFTPLAPPSRSHQPRSNRSNGYRDLFDDQYSSDESDTPTGQNGYHPSLRGAPSSHVGEKRGNPHRKGTSAASSVQSQDPPDEPYINRGSGDRRGRDNYNRSSRHEDRYTRDNYEQDRGSSSRRDSNRSSRGKSPRTPNHSSHDDFSNNNNKSSLRLSKRLSANDYPLQDAEEELYEQYQDDLFHQQPYVQEEHTSSQYGQFNIAPLVEMAPMGGKSKKQKKSKKERTHDDGAWQWPRPNKGRYSEILPDQNEEDVEHDIDDILNAIPGTQHKKHKEYYNLDNDKRDESDDDDDDDEERPLHRSNSSSSLQIQRKKPSPQSPIEKCLNGTLLAVIALLTLVYIREHTPWYKAYQSRVAMEKYEQSLTKDPMSVYNTNDDDSTHTKDHDPTNKYNKFTAGERISDRKPEKSLHHGFMDENYENRPAAKNSGVATAKKAGVKDKTEDPETAAFLASVSSSSTGKKKVGEVKTQQQQPPPPPRPVDKTGLDSNSFDSGGNGYGNNDGSGSTAGAPGAASMVGGGGIDGSSQNDQSNGMQAAYSSSFTSSYTAQSTGEGQPASESDESGSATMNGSGGGYSGTTGVATSEIVASQGQTYSNSYEDAYNEGMKNGYSGTTGVATPEIVASQGQTYSNSYEDAYSEGMKNGYYSGTSGEPSTAIVASQTQTFTSSNQGRSSGFDGQPANGGIAYSTNNNPGPISSEQSMMKYSESLKANPQPQSSPLSALSAFDQSMITQDVKSVYKDSFFRWNHRFRQEGNEEDNGAFDVPVFWRIPRSASGVVEATMSYCYGLTVASAMGAGFEDGTLQKIKTPTGAVFVNVDVSTPDGIKRAADMNLGSSRVADVISSPFIYETTALFQDIPETGKCFTLLRHPVDRAVSFYHLYQHEDSTHPNTAQYQGMTIDEYAEAASENNWMVRFLTSKRSGTLSWHDLEAAKEVFGRKCLVGLSDQAEESIRRYARFFRWDEKVPDSTQKESCLKTTLSKHDKREQHPTYDGTDAWEVLRKKNEYDVLLYEYAKNLFSQQTQLYENYE